MKISKFTISSLKYLVPFALIFPSLALAVDDATVQAIDSKASSAQSKADGNNSRIQALEAADQILNNRIDNIQLTPGPAGPQGPAGADGAQGPAGADGAQGPAGPAGAEGVAGADGAQGPAGPQGPAGADGVAGADGAQGPAGPQGGIGPIGLTGATGATGAQGIQGEQGPQGIQGESGPQGPQGIQGDVGPIGLTGPAGTQGADGAQGPAGPQGPAGADGAEGPQGPAGADGVAGPQGPPGAGGDPGPAGPSGEKIYARGDTGPAGGIVIYVTHDGKHGIEASRDDLFYYDAGGIPRRRVPFGCVGTDLKINGSMFTGIGGGELATETILQRCPDQTSDCGSLELNASLFGLIGPSEGIQIWEYCQYASATLPFPALMASGSAAGGGAENPSLGGYWDWYLPSVAELAMLYRAHLDFPNIVCSQSLNGCPGFMGPWYWSSNDNVYPSTHGAVAMCFSNNGGCGGSYAGGDVVRLARSSERFVRAVRKF